MTMECLNFFLKAEKSKSNKNSPVFCSGPETEISNITTYSKISFISTLMFQIVPHAKSISYISQNILWIKFKLKLERK